MSKRIPRVGEHHHQQAHETALDAMQEIMQIYLSELQPQIVELFSDPLGMADQQQQMVDEFIGTLPPLSQEIETSISNKDYNDQLEYFRSIAEMRLLFKENMAFKMEKSENWHGVRLLKDEMLEERRYVARLMNEVRDELYRQGVMVQQAVAPNAMLDQVRAGATNVDDLVRQMGDANLGRGAAAADSSDDEERSKKRKVPTSSAQGPAARERGPDRDDEDRGAGGAGVAPRGAASLASRSNKRNRAG